MVLLKEEKHRVAEVWELDYLADQRDTVEDALPIIGGTWENEEQQAW